MELLSSALKPQKRCWPAWGVACALSLFTPPPWAQDTTMTPGERELKVAFIYNFIRFTDWPEDTGNPLTLCVRGPDPFGTPLDALQGKGVGARTLAIQRRGNEPLKGCQAVFIGSSVFAAWPKTILELQGRPVLTSTWPWCKTKSRLRPTWCLPGRRSSSSIPSCCGWPPR